MTYGFCDAYKALGRGKPVWNMEYCDSWSVSAVLCYAVLRCATLRCAAGRGIRQPGCRAARPAPRLLRLRQRIWTWEWLG